MAEQLSGVTVVIFIACGVLTFILMFLFAKRQITRFALKSRRGPHIPIGHDAPKFLRRELERRLDRIREIKYEPLLQQEENDSFNSCQVNNREAIAIHHYRMKAVDAVTSFLKELNSPYHRRPGENLRAFLITTLGATYSKLINSICDLYEHARHDPQEFNEDEFKNLNELLFTLWQSLNTMSPVKTVKSMNTKIENDAEPRPEVAGTQIITLVQRNVNSADAHEDSNETTV